MNDDRRRVFSARRPYTSVLLGERVVSKAAGWGSNPHARADCRRGSTEKGVRLVSGTMLVRIQSSALFRDFRGCPSSSVIGRRTSLLVADCIGLSAGSGPGSTCLEVAGGSRLATRADLWDNVVGGGHSITDLSVSIGRGR